MIWTLDMVVAVKNELFSLSGPFQATVFHNLKVYTGDIALCKHLQSSSHWVSSRPRFSSHPEGSAAAPGLRRGPHCPPQPP